MPVSQESIRPLDGAIIDYCCAFFGRTLTLSWQDLSAQDRGNRKVLLSLKDHFLAALTHDFLGCISAVEEVCDAPRWEDKQHGVEFLDALEAALVRQCTQSCAESLLGIQRQLQAASSYNVFAFDPRTIMAYVVAAVFNSKLDHKAGSALCYAFINRLGLSIGLFYATLEDVLRGYASGNEFEANARHDQQDELLPERLLSQDLGALMASSRRAAGEPAGKMEINNLTGYIQRFYTSNLFTQSNPPSLAALFQNIYATLICYVRDSCDEVEKKSQVLCQVLQELYSLTELESALFLQKNKTFDRITNRLSEPEPYLSRTLNYVSDELAAFNRTHQSSSYGLTTVSFDDEPPASPLDNSCERESLEFEHQNRPSDLLNLQMVKSVLEQDAFSGVSSTQQALTTNTFQHVERLINDALMSCSIGEVSHFIDRYWRHALLVVGLREGLDSLAWQEATALLEDICYVQVMAAIDESLQGVIIDCMREIGKHYLSYNDFLEREEYLQAVDVVITRPSSRVTSRH